MKTLYYIYIYKKSAVSPGEKLREYKRNSLLINTLVIMFAAATIERSVSNQSSRAIDMFLSRDG